MAIGYSSKFGTITSLNDLLGPKFKDAVALNGNPTSANAALNGVMMASLAEGGSASRHLPGRGLLLQAQGRQATSPPCQATGATIKAGTTPVVFNWDYLNLPSYVGVSNWKVFIPQNAVLGGYYAQAINKSAPHPAAARLWEEFLYSQAAGGRAEPLAPGRRPAGGAGRPCSPTAPSTRPRPPSCPRSAGPPVFLSGSQTTDAADYLAANWAKAVS